jgi:hypothetical protein
LPIRKITDRDQGADPRSHEAGNQDQRQLAATDARRLDQDHRGDDRRAEQERESREDPRRGDQLTELGGSVPAQAADREKAEAAAEGHQRRLGTEDYAETDPRETGENDARDFDRHGR